MENTGLRVHPEESLGQEVAKAAACIDTEGCQKMPRKAEWLNFSEGPGWFQLPARHSLQHPRWWQSLAGWGVPALEGGGATPVQAKCLFQGPHMEYSRKIEKRDFRPWW